MGNDDIDMKPFEELVHETNQIYQSAYALLLPEAEQICSKNCSQSEVEHFLDYALSFCGSHEVLVLFKNVCRKSKRTRNNFALNMKNMIWFLI